MRALVNDIFSRHLDQALVLTQPSLLLMKQFSPPIDDPVDIHLLLVHSPAMQVVIGKRRIRKGYVIHEAGVIETFGARLEVSGRVVSASVLVLGKGVFHAVVVQEVGGVVVVVEVFVAPEMPLDDFAGLDAIAAGGAFAVAQSIILISWCDFRRGVRQGGFAVAECGAQVVAVRAGDWTFADESGDECGC